MFKKIVILLAILAFPLATFGAIKVAQEIKSWDYIAQIQTFNKGNYFIYEVKNTNSICYVMVGDDTKYVSQPELSCVNSVTK